MPAKVIAPFIVNNQSKVLYEKLKEAINESTSLSLESIVGVIEVVKLDLYMQSSDGDSN